MSPDYLPPVVYLDALIVNPHLGDVEAFACAHNARNVHSADDAHSARNARNARNACKNNDFACSEIVFFEKPSFVKMAGLYEV